MERLRVLLVDDESELVSTLKERLELRKISASFALNGSSALKILEEQDFDVVVLDIHMPGTSGIDVMKKIKEIKPEIEVILLTGRGSEKDREKGLKLGAFDYVIKPVNIDLLIGKINKAVGHKERG